MDGFVIPTRQKTDVLFQSFVALAAGKSFTSEIARVAGYAQIAIFAISDQGFSITVNEAAEIPPTLEEPQQALVPIPNPPPLPPPSPSAIPTPPAIGVGPLVQTLPAINSSLVSSQQQVCMRVQPCGTFMQMVLTNTGADETLLNFSVLGYPLS